MSEDFLYTYISWLDGYSYPEEKFVSEYLHGDREEAIEYIEILNPDYDKGYLLIVVIREGDVESLQKLLEKRPKRKYLTSALSTAALYKDEECTKLLMGNGANPEEYRGTTAWDFVSSVVKEMSRNKI
ncbi:hypothetical protein D1R32_gp269 [Tunisvirus fontaine2]|uniref:Ankyrin repeat-containing protein n=1 Tax=Tunisvirus fontaine2 TaxID=1421067 RepID=V9SF89_9VIRU|nr:hypothetical protein D1R32_gp269 [Tunisvirus fontaine2]AHC54986.1 hypothetical protein TNS_ORF268 [Tunisvirus fontaine2]